MKRILSRVALCAAAALIVIAMSTADAQVATDSGPASAHSSITPSDSTSLLDSNNQPYCRAIFVGGAGDISITDVQNVTIVYTVPAATLLPFRPKRVNSTGTTATGIVCWRS